MKRLIVVLSLAVGLTACGPVPGPQPPSPPTPPPPATPSPVCAPGQHHSCYHNPGSGWVYACPVYDLTTGGVVGVLNVESAEVCAKPTPIPGPPPTQECVLSGEPSVMSTQPNTLGTYVNAAMKRLRPHCEVGGDCLINDYTRQSWQAAVNAELRKAGFCAGQHTPSTDEIAVAVKASDPWQGFHVFVGDDSIAIPPPSRRTVKWSPQAFSGSWVPPSGSPGSPAPPPVSGACPAPQPPRVWTAETLPRGWGQDQIGKPRWGIACKPHGAVIDCTPKLPSHSCDYCASIGMGEIGGNIRCDCPVRPDGHPDRVACEDYLAEGKLVLEARNGATCERTAPTMFRPNGGNCRLCNPAKTVCGEWH